MILRTGDQVTVRTYTYDETTGEQTKVIRPATVSADSTSKHASVAVTFEGEETPSAVPARRVRLATPDDASAMAATAAEQAARKLELDDQTEAAAILRNALSLVTPATA